MNPRELARLEPQHTIVYGPSKSGKSTLVSKLALLGIKLIWISLDGGHRIIYKLPPEALDNIDLIILRDTRNFPVAIDTCRKLQRGPATICHNHGVVACTVCKQHGQPFSNYDFRQLSLDTVVVWDHLTQLTDSCMANICKGKDVDYKPKLDDWGSLRFHMHEFLSNIQHAPYNVIAIAQEQEVEMEDGSKKIAPSIGSREFGRSVGSYFDNMVYLDVMNSSHRVGSSTTWGVRVITGSRDDFAIEKEKEASLGPLYLPGFKAAKEMPQPVEVPSVLSIEQPKTAIAMGGSSEATSLLNKLKGGLKK